MDLTMRHDGEPQILDGESGLEGGVETAGGLGAEESEENIAGDPDKDYGRHDDYD